MTDTTTVEEEPVPVVPETNFETYVWEEDEEWQILIRRLEFPPHYNEEQKQKYLMKRKLRYFKSNINPNFEIQTNIKPPKPETNDDPIINGRSSQNIYEKNIDSQNSSTSSTNMNSNPPTSTNTATNPNTSSTNANTSSTNADTSSTNANPTNASGNSRPRNQSYQYPYGRYQPPPSKIGTMIAPLLDIFFLLAQWFILVNAIASIALPACYTFTLLAMAITHVIATVQNCGRPRFAAWYAQLVMKEENTMIAVYALILWMGAKHIVFLSPIILRSLFMACYLTQACASKRLPAFVFNKIKPLLKMVTARHIWFNRAVAACEVFVGVFLIFACFIMSRTVIMTLIYWQVMQARYMMSGYIRLTFSNVHMRISSVLSSIPFVYNLYMKLAGFLGNMVDPAIVQQRMQGGGGGISGMVSKMCTIM